MFSLESFGSCWLGRFRSFVFLTFSPFSGLPFPAPYCSTGCGNRPPISPLGSLGYIWKDWSTCSVISRRRSFGFFTYRTPGRFLWNLSPVMARHLAFSSIFMAIKLNTSLTCSSTSPPRCSIGIAACWPFPLGSRSISLSASFIVSSYTSIFIACLLWRWRSRRLMLLVERTCCSLTFLN